MADYTSIHTGAKIDDAVTKVNGENLVANKALVTDASKKLVSTSVTDTEISYLSGASSNIQTQLGNKLNSSDYTANDVLAKIKTVDGVGSGLDADTFQGSTPLAFALSGHTHSNYEPTLTKGNLLGTTSQILVSGGTNAVIGSGASLSLAATPIVGGIEITSATINTVPIINPLKQVASSSVTSTELGHLSGVTSGIQSQLNSKEPTLTKGNLTGTNILVSNGTNSVIGTGTSLSLASTPILEGLEVSSLTANRALYSDNLKQVKSSNVTDTELGYLSGVTSSIQTQINNIGAVTKGNLTSTSLTVTNGTDAVLGAGTQINLPATPIVSNLTITDLTANRALVSNTDKQVISSSVTNTELGYLSGVTSGVQSQFNKTLEEVDTIANVKLKGIANNRNVYCRATNTIYTYLASGAAYTPNDFNILTTADGGNTRWIAIQDMLYTNLQTSTYSGTGFLSRTTTTMSIVGQNFTIAPTGSSFDIYINGTKYVKTSSSITLPLTVGMHYIYFDSSAILTTSMTPWEIPSSKVFVASAYCNGNEYTISDERHGANRNMDWHRWSHYTVGARFESGLVGTFSTSATSFTSGKIHDEDIANVIAAQSGNCILKWYRNPVNFYFTATPIAVTANIVAGALKYDNSGTLTSVSNNQYTTNWIYATNDITNPIYMVTGQAQYSSQANAEAATLPDFANFPNNEMKLIYAVVWRNASGTPTYISSKDYRFSIGLPGGGTTATNASSVAYIPYSTISSTNVQSAIQELTDEVNSLVGLTDCMVYKGTIDCSGNPDYPAADAGWTYKVSVSGKIGGASGKVVEVGDLVICFVDSSVTGNEATVGANWNVIQGNIDGAVTSNSVSSNDNSIARMDLTSGKVIQTSLATIDDNGSINIPTGQTYKINNSALTYTDVGAAASSHSHGNITNAGAIGSTTGLPIITTTSGVLSAGSFGTTLGTFCQGNDSRLSDTRLTTNSLTFNNSGTGGASGSTFNGSTALTVSYNTVGAAPLSHTHGNITNAGAIGTTADLPVKTTTSGVLTTGTYGTLSGTTDQVSLSASGTNVLNGTSITLSLPQSIAISSTPTFAGLTSTGNILVGSGTLASWRTTYRAIEFYGSAILASNTASAIYLMTNAYYNNATSTYKYKISAVDKPAQISLYNGTMLFEYAAVGQIDSDVTFIQMFKLDSGYASFGTSAPSSSYKVRIDKSETDMTTNAGLSSIVTQTLTTNGTRNTYGAQFTCNTIVPTGVTNSGFNLGVGGYSAIGAAASQGTLTTNIGGWFETGISSCLAGYITTDTFGVKSTIYRNTANGTMTNAYLFYGNYSGSSSTITNSPYGIYLTGESLNYLSGVLGIGVIPDTKYKLYISQTNTNASLYNGQYIGQTNVCSSASTYYNRGIYIDQSVNSYCSAANAGHTIGIYIDNYISSISHTSSLAAQYGFYTVNGINSCGIGGTITNAYSYRATMYCKDADATITNAYLYHGSYDHTLGTITNKYGIHITGESLNYLSGYLGIGVAPTYNLHIYKTHTNVDFYSIYNDISFAITSNGTYNNESLYSGIARSYVSAGITNSGWWVGIESSSYINNANMAGTISNLSGLYSSTGLSGSVTSTAVVTNAYGVYSIVHAAATSGSTITNSYMFYGTKSGTSTTITNNWGLYLSGESKNYISGNIGIKTTDIEAWHSDYRAIEFYASTIMASVNNTSLFILSNSYYDGAWKYKTTNFAAYYKVSDGIHTFQVAPSGTVDTAITWITAMTINNSGNIGIGTTDIEAWSNFKAIEFYKSAIMAATNSTEIDILSNAYYDGTNKYKSTAAASAYSQSTGSHIFYVAASGTIDTAITWATALTIANSGNSTFSGNLGVGTTSNPLYTLYTSKTYLDSTGDVYGGYINHVYQGTTATIRNTTGLLLAQETSYISTGLTQTNSIGLQIYNRINSVNHLGTITNHKLIDLYGGIQSCGTGTTLTESSLINGTMYNADADGTITNGYLLKLIWSGTAGTIGTKYGIYTTGQSVNVIDGAIRVSGAVMETSQVGGINIRQGTDPTTNSIDQVTLYATAGASATLGLCTEATVVTESVTSDRTLSIKINGTVYKLCLKA